MLKDDGLGALQIRNLADNDFRYLHCYNLKTCMYEGIKSANFYRTKYGDLGSYVALQGWNGAWTEHARLASNNFELKNGKLTGDLDVSANNIGPLLIDRTTATKYRLYVDNGVLSIEAV